MPESSIRDACKKELKRRFPGCFVTAWSDRNARGMPDLMCFAKCHHPHTIGIETKVPKTGRLSEIQKVVHRKLRENGVEIVVARSVKEMLVGLHLELPE